jgi:hypothetical protein
MTLQYADDTVLSSTPDRASLRNLKVVLLFFEAISGMRINFYKSEVIPMNVDDREAHEIAHLLNCPIGALPFKYLGVPLHYKKLKREDIQPVVDKFIKRITGWRGRLLTYSSRLTLIKSCLSSITMYLMSFLKFLKWAIRLIESQMSNCLGNDEADAHRYHLANWRLVTMKEFGGGGGFLGRKIL